MCKSGDPVEVTAGGDALRPPDSHGSTRFGRGWQGHLAAQSSHVPPCDHVRAYLLRRSIIAEDQQVSELLRSVTVINSSSLSHNLPLTLMASRAQVAVKDLDGASSGTGLSSSSLPPHRLSSSQTQCFNNCNQLPWKTWLWCFKLPADL